MGQASDCPHLANERIRRLNLVRGKNVVKNLLVEVGQAAGAEAAAASASAAAAPAHQ
jgi:di- and tripeptidase/Cys-Gly metallodipeptidase DUG1